MQEAAWRDAARGRELPVRLYLPVGATNPCPVILFSHGLGGSRRAGEAWGRHWASHGYACAHLQHPGSDETVWRGNLRAMSALREAMDAEQWLARVGDVRFAIDRLTELNRPGAALAGRLDLARIGLSGHSFGAGTTLGVTGQGSGRPLAGRASLADPRVKAGIALSPPVARQGNLDAVYGGIRVPLLVMTGTLDDSPISDTKAAERRIPYDHMAGPDKYLLIFDGGDHMVFNGGDRRRGAAARDPAIHRLIRLSSTAFWDAFLRDDPAARAWLRTGGLSAAMQGQGSFEQKQ